MAKRKKEKKQKGQMFIIAAIFMIVAIVMIKNSIGTSAIQEESRFQASNTADRTIENVRSEYSRIAALAQFSSQTGGYLQDFSSEIRHDMDSRIFYVLVLTNGTTQDCNVTTGNYLGEGMNVSVNASGTVASAVMKDMSSSSTVYHTTGSMLLLVKYGGDAETFNLSTTGNSEMIFTDITINSGLVKRELDKSQWAW